MSVVARDICVRYGRRTVLERVDFDAAPGQVSIIVGPNGSGKTTLLRALTADLPYRGQVMLNGQDIARRPAWKLAAERAVLPQNLSVAFSFSVAEILRMGQQAGLGGPDPALPLRALAAVGLGGYEGRLYHALSGGEQQRVQMARVLTQVWAPIQEGVPRWLFLDEPVSALDIGHQLALIALIRDYAHRGGGVIAVMHDLNLTAMCADQVTVMTQGAVLASGPVETVLTDAILSRAYGCPLRVNAAPPGAMRFVLPQAAGH